jgi:hypothetical protein
MAWYQASGVWAKRAAISVDIPGGGTTTVDVDITIPREWDEFWDAIDSAGNELRVVWYDGQTKLVYDVDNGSGGAFDKTNRLGRIRIDGMTVPNATAMLQIWLYFASTSNQGDGSAAVTIASARNGYIEVSSPGFHRFAHRPQFAQMTRPRDIIHKTAAEQQHVWIRYDRVIAKRPTPGNLSPIHDELMYVDVGVENTSGVDQTTMYDYTATRFVYSRGIMWVRVLIKAGTSGTNYTLVVKPRVIAPGATTASQQLETRIGVSVRDTRILS